MGRRNLELARGAIALLLLIGILVGLPSALVTQVGWPLPTELPDWATVERALTTGQLDSWALVKAVALLVWIAWAQLAASAISEVVAIARRRRVRAVPSARLFRLAAANLVTTATLLLGSTGRLAEASVPPPDLHIALANTSPSAALVGDGPIPRPLQPAPSLTLDPGLDQGASVERPTDAAGPTWRVAPRDTLWGIAETTLGDGLRWREIHVLNVGRQQPDGGSLRADDDLIRPGWILKLPHDATVSQPTTTPDVTARAEADDGASTITVQPGDTLWDLADHHLDDAHRWPELYEANRLRKQPDGGSLTDPDLIHPGWQLRVPSENDGHPVARPEPPPDRSRAGDVAGEDAAVDTAPPVGPLPWAHLDRDNAPPPASASPPSDGTGDADGGHTSHADDASGEAGTDGLTVEDPADESDGWDRSALLAGLGIAAAGIVVTLDRLRRSQQRRRSPGIHMQLPDGELARAERRVRGLADQETADLLDVALRSLAASCAQAGRAVPDVALVSVGVGDVAVHLASIDTDPVEGWRLEDAGMTWVLPRPDELGTLRQLAATALSPAPLLVTIGTHTGSQRRVLLNLGHAGLVTTEADDQTARTILLALALELATTARADGLRILLTGAADQLSTLERIRCVSGTEAAEALHGASQEADSDDADVIASVCLEPPTSELRDALASVRVDSARTVAAIGIDLPDPSWRITVDETLVRLAPYDLELQPLELSREDVDAIEQLLIDAARPAFAEVDVADVFDPEPPASPSTNGHAAWATEPEAAGSGPTGVEVRVLGPVEVAGAGDFASSKAEELVVYLALHRHAVDADSLQEALWPGETPNAGRLHTTVWRARQALGDDADGKPYLPNAKQGRYHLSDQASSDLQRFESHVGNARSDPAKAAEELRAALKLVRGQPLSSTSREYAWAPHLLHAIEQQVSDAAHDLATLYLERGEPHAARWAAERGMLADPYCELLYRDQMLAAAATGNMAEVHAAMRRLRRRLAAEASANDTDDSLTPATTQLYSKLTRQRQSDPTRSAGKAMLDEQHAAK